jgi:hypothetical protein
MGYYRSVNSGPLPHFSDADRYNNRIAVANETNPQIIVDNGVFFLEHVYLETGKTISIVDGNGQTLMTGLDRDLNVEISPIRLDYGFVITGDVLLLKGFIIQGCLPA